MNYKGEWWKTSYPEDDWKIFEDFRYFLILVWVHLNLPPPTDIQYNIASYLQYGARRKIIMAFRGIGKSWITSAFVCWLLLRNPQLKILVVSASKDRADQFSTFTKRLIGEMDILKHMVAGKDQRNSNLAFDVAPAMADHSPSVKSVGIFGQLTGGRADVIIADDVEVPNNSETQGMRDKLAERVKEFDAVLKPNGKITYLGTPQTEESLYNELPKRGYEVRIWPARYPDKVQAEKRYGLSLAPYILNKLIDALVGLSTDPKRFSDMDLQEREASYGSSGFALQFMLDTSLSDQDRYPLKLADLITMSLDKDVAPEKLIWSRSPEYVLQNIDSVGLRGDRFYAPAATLGGYIPYTGSVLAIDPSGRGKDELGYAIVKMLNGYLFVLRAGGLKGGYADSNLETLAKLAKEYSVNAVIIEANFGDGMFTKIFQPILLREHQCKVEEVRHNKQKELRIIDTLEPVMSRHKLVIDSSIVEHDRQSTKEYPSEIAHRYQLFYQLTRITKNRGALVQDDRLDALAIAVAYWSEKMNQDEDKKVQERQKRILEAELAAFMGRTGMSIDGLAMGMSPEMALKAARTGVRNGRSKGVRVSW